MKSVLAASGIGRDVRRNTARARASCWRCDQTAEIAGNHEALSERSAEGVEALMGSGMTRHI